MQLHRQVGVFGLAAFPQSFLLEQQQHHRKVSLSGRGAVFPFFTLLNKHIKLVGLSGIWWRLLEQMCTIWMPLAFHFMFTQAMGKLTPSGLFACYLSQVQARCFKASGFLPDRCVKPDVGMCQYYLGLVPHGSFAQHRYLGSSLFLQTFDGIALRSQNLPHKIELMATKKGQN